MPLPSYHWNYQDPLSRSGHKPTSTVKFFPSLLFLPPKRRWNRLLHSPPPLPYFHLLTELRICCLQLLSISVFKRFCIKLLSHKWQLFPPPGEESNHARAFQQEQWARDVNLLHVVWVLGLPRRTRLTQITEGTMLYSHRERTARDWLESAGPSAPAGLALELMRRQAAHTLPVLPVKDPWEQTLQWGRSGARRRHIKPRTGKGTAKETRPAQAVRVLISLGKTNEQTRKKLQAQVTLTQPRKDGARSCAWLPFSPRHTLQRRKSCMHECSKLHPRSHPPEMTSDVNTTVGIFLYTYTMRQKTKTLKIIKHILDMYYEVIIQKYNSFFKYYTYF